MAVEFYKIGLIVAPVVALVSWANPDSPKVSPAQQMAKILAPVLPKSLPGGVTIQSAKAEDDLLAITVDVPSDTGWSSDEMSKMIAASFCQTGGSTSYFRKGGRVRFDISNDGGSASAGAILETC